MVKLDSYLLFMVDTGRGDILAELHKKLTADGRRVTYQNCVDAGNELKAQLFDEYRTQYPFILSYIIEINKRGHKAYIELFKDKIFGSSSYTSPAFICSASLQIAISIWMAHL